MSSDIRQLAFQTPGYPGRSGVVLGLHCCPGIDNKVANPSYLSACAETFASDMAMRVMVDALQTMGG